MPQSGPPQRAVKNRGLRPAQAIFLGFFLTICAGTILLMLPAATADGQGAGFTTALFTSTSAVCVTGLIIEDTPVYWSGFGEAVILILIQLGGLGVMTFASVIGLAVLRKLSLRTRLIAAAEAKRSGLEDLRSVITGIVKISLSIEAVLAVILTLRFWLSYEESFAEALWLGVFHAVSAFNNAGFALFSDSMMDFVSDPVICLPMAVAIILGGLGFPVIMQLRKHLRTPRLWSMHTRLVVAGTAGGIKITTFGVLLFIGRIGPITVASVLALRERRIMYELPKERPIIG